MSDSVLIYLGPVFVFNKELKIARKERECPNHHKNQTGAFCSECGAKIIEVDHHHTVKYPETIPDYFSYSPSHRNILIPDDLRFNLNAKNFFREGSETEVSLTPDMITKSLNDFMADPLIQQTINELKEYEGQYVIDFRLVSYWSY